jgi:hypothetical protein
MGETPLPRTFWTGKSSPVYGNAEMGLTNYHFAIIFRMFLEG